MNIDNLRQLLDEATRHDAALRYCRTCGSRYYDDAKGDVHDRPASECREGGCLAPEDHHPFVEGALPSYEEAAIDRRNLVRVAPDLLAAIEALERLLSDPRISLPFAVPEVFRTGKYPPDSAVMVVEDARAVLRRLRGEEGDR